MNLRLTPVIMCGGAGTRLWPVSRESMPKQFLPVVGNSSTFHQLLSQLRSCELFTRPVVVTHSDFRFVVAEQLREAGVEADIVLEPVRRDSGLAVAAATEIVAQRDPQSVVLVLAADNMIRKADAFHAICRAAVEAACAGRIVTFGIKPTYPATRYGYIRPGKRLDGGAILAVDAFVEKPDAKRAQAYIAQDYLWNSGNFVFRVDVMQREIGRLVPPIADAARRAVEGLTRDFDFIRLAEAPFAAAPSLSIDRAVMEKTGLAAVIPADFGWTDVGTWDAVCDVLERDSDGNAMRGPVFTLDSRNVTILSDEAILTAAVGVDDLIVIVTPDAVLVADRSKAESVKDLVERLKSEGRHEAIEHRKIHRPWGSYQSIDLGSRHQVKRIVVKPNGKLSLQKHFHRSEHWVVVRGTAEVTIGDNTTMVQENESVYVPIGSVHRLANPGMIPLELIEVQVGSYLGEDDIVRLDDLYKRK